MLLLMSQPFSTEAYLLQRTLTYFVREVALTSVWLVSIELFCLCLLINNRLTCLANFFCLNCIKGVWMLIIKSVQTKLLLYYIYLRLGVRFWLLWLWNNFRNKTFLINFVAVEEIFQCCLFALTKWILGLGNPAT